MAYRRSRSRRSYARRPVRRSYARRVRRSTRSRSGGGRGRAQTVRIVIQQPTAAPSSDQLAALGMGTAPNPQRARF